MGNSPHPYLRSVRFSKNNLFKGGETMKAELAFVNSSRLEEAFIGDLQKWKGDSPG